MDMLPPEQMAFLIPYLLGMVSALFVMWVIYTVEKWRGRKEVRRLAAHFIDPTGDMIDPELTVNVTPDGAQLLEEESKAAMLDSQRHLYRMKEIVETHQKPAAAGE